MSCDYSLIDGIEGSYSSKDVLFLLAKIEMDTTPLAERERLIASGQMHYSEMIGDEDRPSRKRMRLFRRCLQSNGDRLALGSIRLARELAQSTKSAELVIVSITRAGTPIGVLLKRILEETDPHLEVHHYSISVIRDRGIDFVALGCILERHDSSNLRFVDGWTGKGTIAKEIKNSLSLWTHTPDTLDPGLWVPLDVCGVAKVSASTEDYLIPSTLLGGTVSGLLSRSILRRAQGASESTLHQCVELTNLRRYDLSRWFIEEMMERVRTILHHSSDLHFPCSSGGDSREVELYVDQMLEEHSMSDKNKVKVGIGESIRVLLRRAPKAVYVSDQASSSDAEIIRELAAERNLEVTYESLPYAATAVICEGSKD